MQMHAATAGGGTNKGKTNKNKIEIIKSKWMAQHNNQTTLLMI